jgi:polysaccharide pyruvyl transferase WcaK-like protein
MGLIGIAGTFDVENYGDCLFPIIAQYRLASAGHQVRSFSPTANATRWSDSAVPEKASGLIGGQLALDGMLIGGGNVVHNHADTLPQYVEGNVADTAYLSLWCGATLACAARGIPVAWNAPGVTRQFIADEQAILVPAITRQASYLSVRDDISAARLGNAIGAKVNIVPDTVVELSRAWPKAILKPVFEQMLARKGAAKSAGYFAVHVKRRSLNKDSEPLAPLIVDFARVTGLTPLFVALAPCHDDDGAARDIAAQLGIDHVLLDDSQTLQEVAASIALSAAYIGPSLHGYITSFSYGVPGAIVAHPRLGKFAGFLSHVGRDDDLVSSWAEAFAKMKGRIGETVRTEATDQYLQHKLDDHWNTILATVKEKTVPSPDAVMANMLQLMLRRPRDEQKGGIASRLRRRIGRIVRARQARR